jgi:hypothetical protein
MGVRHAETAREAWSAKRRKHLIASTTQGDGASTIRLHPVRGHTLSWLEQPQRPLQLVVPSGLEAAVSPTDAAAGQSPMGTPLPLLLSRIY